ncbi:MAG: hypothetical protein JNM25_17760 [Planctomycetes bacterium]|nr:hypothetical protein [Planctomycetota bacterium]
MTGESQRDDDNDDFLDDDFVIEDIAPKNEDLDRLFETPPGHSKAGAAAAEPDAEDVLFAEPELGYAAPTTFQGGPEFAEGAAGTWDGDALDLEAEAASNLGAPPEAMAAAEASFAKELDSLLQGDDDFALDSEQELEVIGAGAAGAGDGISEFEQSGPFVLDDGDGMWQDESADSGDELGVPLGAASGDEQVAPEPGWEPLPAARVDDLAEVGEVARAEADEPYEAADADADPVYGEAFADGAEPELVGVAAEAEGHDIYVQDEDDNEVIGARERGGRGFRVLLPLAATLTVLAAGAVVVLRPEWLGLRLQPERVQQAEITRPTVAVPVPTPAGPAPVVAVTEPPPVAPPTPPPVEPPPPAPVEPTPPTVVVSEPPPADPAPPVAVEPPSPEVPPVAVEPPAPADPALPVVTAPTPELPGWPVLPAVTASPKGADGLPQQRNRLVRVSDDLMIGEPDDLDGRTRSADGVAPGSRAFAQLQNGNFFIGNVKTADAQRITLRVDNGEVTIPRAAIARLTELGSADYEDLQKVTSGFVRLTNNNRLVGGILSGIADDHVVLEFRKNRVMLPKALVGQVVQGEGDAAIRLDTTREEDDWLRRLIERQLGSGTGAEPPTPPTPPQGSQSPR